MYVCIMKRPLPFFLKQRVHQIPPWLGASAASDWNKLETCAGDIGQKYCEDFGREKRNKFETETTTHRDSLTVELHHSTGVVKRKVDKCLKMLLKATKMNFLKLTCLKMYWSQKKQAPKWTYPQKMRCGWFKLQLFALIYNLSPFSPRCQ